MNILSKESGLVTIIIPSYNRKNRLRRCLKSIFSQNYSALEIIVIDNGSTDQTVLMIARDFPTVRIIKNRINLGASQARNQGIVRARSRYIWFLDSDSVLPKKDLLSRIVYLWKNTSNPGIIGGELDLEERKKRKCVRAYYFNKQNGMSKTHKHCDISLGDIVKPDFLPTSNFFTSKKILYQIGGFDPYYFYLAEDKDVSYKIKKLGYKIMSSVNVSVIHDGRCKTDLYTDDKLFFDLHKNRIRFVIINYKFRNFLCLPFIDIKERRNLRIHSKRRVLLLIGAYLRNVLFLPRELFLKIKKPNYLREIS